MKLKPKQKAPSLTGKDINGHAFDLDELRGSKEFLTFYRTAACPFCNLRVHQVLQRNTEWKTLGVKTLGVFASTAEDIRQYAGKQSPTFTLVAIPDYSLYHAYGINKARSGMFKAMLRIGAMMKIMTKGFFSLKTLSDPPILPADFLIDEQGVIRQAYYGQDFGDHLPLEEVERWIKENSQQ